MKSRIDQLDRLKRKLSRACRARLAAGAQALAELVYRSVWKIAGDCELPDDAGGELDPFEPPDAGGELEPPDAGGELEPPDAGGELEPPDAGGELEPPDAGGELEPPDAGLLKKCLAALPDDDRHHTLLYLAFLLAALERGSLLEAIEHPDAGGDSDAGSNEAREFLKFLKKVK